MFPTVLHSWHPRRISGDSARSPRVAERSADVRDDVSCALHAINYKFTKQTERKLIPAGKQQQFRQQQHNEYAPSIVF